MAMRIPKVRYADADGVEHRARGARRRPARRRAHLGRVPEHARPRDRPTLQPGDDACAAFARVIVLDRRRHRDVGSARSQGSVAPLEQQVADVVAVMDNAGRNERSSAVRGRRAGGNAVRRHVPGAHDRARAQAATCSRAGAGVTTTRSARTIERAASDLAVRGAPMLGAIPTTRGASCLTAPSRQVVQVFREGLGSVQSISASRAVRPRPLAPAMTCAAAAPVDSRPARISRSSPARRPRASSRAVPRVMLIPDSELGDLPGQRRHDGAAPGGREPRGVRRRRPPDPGRRRPECSHVLFTDIVSSTEDLRRSVTGRGEDAARIGTKWSGAGTARTRRSPGAKKTLQATTSSTTIDGDGVVGIRRAEAGDRTRHASRRHRRDALRPRRRTRRCAADGYACDTPMLDGRTKSPTSSLRR